MADKLTHQIIDALTRAAAEPTGLPLYAGKADPGLFPNVASAKPAAQKCLSEDLIRPTEPAGKPGRERYALSEKGWEYLLAAVNPKQVLEDFVRVLEARQGEVSELLGTARRMADSLHGLKEAVARVLPAVSAAKVVGPIRAAEVVGACRGPTPPGPPSLQGGGAFGDIAVREPGSRSDVEDPLSPLPAGRGAGGVGSGGSMRAAALAHLAAHPGPTDCTLPELFRAVAGTGPLTIGEFHDCLRELHADGRVTLTQWTGPLYALPEPQFALLVGHGIAYYASLRSQEPVIRIQESDSAWNLASAARSDS